MQEKTPRRRNRVFKSLHKPLTYLGVERTVFYFVCVGAVGVFNLFESLRADAATINPRDILIDESKQADIENLGDCLRVLGDGQSLGEFSLTIVLYAEDKRTLDRVLPDVVRIFTSADGTLFSETYNQLNAYFAAVPGNYRHNLRRHYLLNSNYADISFLFTIQPGETWNDHLHREYLAVLETDNATPYYLNLHNREIAHTLILGATGSGKAFLRKYVGKLGASRQNGAPAIGMRIELIGHSPNREPISAGRRKRFEPL
jgi:hypothetical protein